MSTINMNVYLCNLFDCVLATSKCHKQLVARDYAPNRNVFALLHGQQSTELYLGYIISDDFNN